MLAKDLSYLAAENMVDYSILLAVEASGDSRSPQEWVWPVFNDKSRDFESIVMGGIIDFLNSPREREGGGYSNITRSFHKDSNVYACRLFYFAATQMFTPCSIPYTGA